jgi:hypothetical protein
MLLPNGIPRTWEAGVAMRSSHLHEDIIDLDPEVRAEELG